MDVKIGDMEIKNCDVDIILEKYSRREYIEEFDGDDMVDIGTKSYEFIIKGSLKFEEFKRLNVEVKKRGNILRFDLGEFKVVIKRFEYRSTGGFVLELIEDVV